MGHSAKILTFKSSVYFINLHNINHSEIFYKCDMKKDLCASELAYFFLKCQPKDTTFLFKPCFAYVPTTLPYMFAHFIYTACSNSQQEPKIPSFPATSVNLPTILHGCYLGRSNVMSASQSITTRNHHITERALCWGQKGRR